MKPKYPADSSDERVLLEKHLDFCRDTVVHKVEGLSEDLARKRLGRTPSSVLGIVKHLENVERAWFLHTFAGKEDCKFDWSEENPDGEFEVAPDDTVESLLERYKVACQESRDICAQYGLDDQATRKSNDGSQRSLRWIYLHMIEETARHNGQLDIYRELLDGVVDSKY